MAPTELGEVVETEANTAWALDDEPELEFPRRWTPARITAAAVGACVVVIAVVYLRDDPQPPVAEPTPSNAVPKPTTAAAPSTPRPSDPAEATAARKHSRLRRLWTMTRCSWLT